MKLFSKDKVPFFSINERETILTAIKNAESKTSGEIRLFIESRCEYTNSLQRAEEVFLKLKMQNTTHRNGILIYIAYKDKDFAIYGDAGCMVKIDPKFWQKQANLLSFHFYKKNHTHGIIQCLENIKTVLDNQFPLQNEKKNELPDEIVFGK